MGTRSSKGVCKAMAHGSYGIPAAMGSQLWDPASPPQLRGVWIVLHHPGLRGIRIMLHYPVKRSLDQFPTTTAA